MSTASVRSIVAIATLPLAFASGCAHRRDSSRLHDLAAREPGVHVRAPFVDVHVPIKPRPQTARVVERRDDFDEEERVSSREDR